MSLKEKRQSMALIYKKKDRIAYITINRSEAMNALNDQSFPEISRAFGGSTEVL